MYLYSSLAAVSSAYKTHTSSKVKYYKRETGNLQQQTQEVAMQNVIDIKDYIQVDNAGQSFMKVLFHKI